MKIDFMELWRKVDSILDRDFHEDFLKNYEADDLHEVCHYFLEQAYKTKELS